MAHALPRRQRLRRTLLLGFLFIFPVTINYYSPYLSVTGLAQGVVAGSVLFWLIWALASLVLGRAACGWICPLAGLQEVLDWARGADVVRVKRLSWLKWGLWGVWMACFAGALATSLGEFTVHITYMTESVVSWDSWITNVVYYGMLGLVLAFAAPLGRRGFCHYGCFFMPMNGVGAQLTHKLGWWPTLRLAADAEACVACANCDRVCTMSLPVQAMVEENRMDHVECVLCGQCVDLCPKGAVRFVWR